MLAVCTIEVPGPDEELDEVGSSDGSGADGSSSVGGRSGADASSGSASAEATGAGDASGDGSASSAHDNCPKDPSSDQTDTDEDGTGDACDQDGFLDGHDPAPLDVDVPGDFSTPEKVLADPRIVLAIEGLRDAGFEFEPRLETDPPDITGYFRKEDGEGEFVANPEVTFCMAGSGSGSGSGNRRSKPAGDGSEQ